MIDRGTASKRMGYLRHSLMVQVYLLAAVSGFSTRASSRFRSFSDRLDLIRRNALGVNRYSMRLHAANAGQFELRSYVQSALLEQKDDKTVVVNTPFKSFKTVDPVFVSLSSALGSYSGDGRGSCFRGLNVLLNTLFCASI